MTQLIAVKHNVEMAHRLSQTPGKCQQIHGHSWQVILKLRGPVDETGKVLEFGEVKKTFRGYLDATFDHRLLLWLHDPLIKNTGFPERYPGIQTFETDPTTENFAAHIHEWANIFDLPHEVEVWETAVNMASAGGPQ